MPGAAVSAQRAVACTRSALRARLEARREELEDTALTRIRAIVDTPVVVDSAYAEGLRRAVTAAVGFGLDSIDRAGDSELSVPVELLAQVRLAARNRVHVGTVMRRYVAGYSLLGFFLIEEACRDDLVSGADLQRLVAAQAGRFDRLLAAIEEEYAREVRALSVSTRRKRVEQVERLLDGELLDTCDIPYDFDGWHLGVAAEGSGSERAVRKLAKSLDCCFLCVAHEASVVWAWLGARRRLDPTELLGSPGLAPERMSLNGANFTVAFGEPSKGLAGWRLTHRQAVTALLVARPNADEFVRYADVALLASASQDNLLGTSLRRLYLDPLSNGRNSESLCETLRAYLEYGRNSASAAAALGVTRQTVNNRLKLVEERIGRAVDACAAELDLALRLAEN